MTALTPSRRIRNAYVLVPELDHVQTRIGVFRGELHITPSCDKGQAWLMGLRVSSAPASVSCTIHV